MWGSAAKVRVLSELRARMCVLGVIGEDLAVFEDCDLVENTRGLNLFVAAVGVDGAGENAGGAVLADFIFEGAPRAPVELRVLRHGITGEEGVL